MKKIILESSSPQLRCIEEDQGTSSQRSQNKKLSQQLSRTTTTTSAFNMGRKRQNRSAREYEDEEEFPTTPMKASDLRKGNYMIINDKPCKVLEMNTSSPGKHGHAKIHFVAMDLTRMKKIETIHPSTHMVMVPQQTKQEFMLISLDEDDMVANLESKGGESRENFPIPTSLYGKGAKQAWARGDDISVVVTKVHGVEQVATFRY